MSSLAVSALRELVDRGSQSCDAGSTRRVQGRPTRGANEVGSQKIVEGMRVALRAQQNTNVSRKNIALQAGVTPALVTYYFPERGSLIEAATLPIVQALVAKVKACVERNGAARQHLVEATAILLESYTCDAVIIALYDHHRASTPDTALPDVSRELDACLTSVFERWLFENPGSVYDADFLQKALVGACKSMARRRIEASDRDTIEGLDHRGSAEIVCSLMLGPASARETTPTATSIGVGDAAL